MNRVKHWPRAQKHTHTHNLLVLGRVVWCTLYACNYSLVLIARSFLFELFMLAEEERRSTLSACVCVCASETFPNFFLLRVPTH